MWVKEAAPELMVGLKKIEKGIALNKKQLTASLKASGKAIEELV
jgi:hypothetical protein